MNNLKKLITILSIVCIASYSSAQTEKDKEIIKDAEVAKETLLKTTPELKNFFDKAAGYVIFPNVGKGGFIVGGASGNGVLYKQGGMELGMASLKKVNIGLQAGGEAIIEVIFFETNTELEEFQKGKFKFDAGASATAIKSGESFNAKYSEGVAVFTQTKGGLMADASVGGQKFKYTPFK
ncbi:lipid-binding SYLF domain-containing protein [Formosa sediminum]|uniref:Lipid-binding SYLF domain-containing protein n=1 Tax=Formosa sediminum TaxID=2594004 RepID=A0A516GTC9_9FLAO|nr:lipid-binding SYLF domain-containing protein [Formosa sediminum]QDO94774.1 lipid-binding SYLF domain-containing protein [Formosa sediminum]